MPQAQTIAVPKRLPLYTPIQTRTSDPPFSKDSRLYNAFAERDAVIDGYQIYKRPGLGTSPVFGTGSGGFAGRPFLHNGLGLYTETGTATVYAVFDNVLYNYNPPAGIPLTVMSSTLDISAPYFFETVGQSALTSRYVVLGNGSAAYVVVLDSGPPFHRQTLSPITDPNFPTTFVTGWVELDGFLYVMDANGSIWGTQSQNNPTIWSSTSVIQANSSSDLGVGIAKQLNYLVAFKQYSTQIFYDAGNPPPGSPLGLVPDSQNPYGCLVGGSIQRIDDTLLWISSNQTISPQVVQMDNLTTRVVSTPDVERFLDNVTWTSSNPNNQVRAWVLKHGGHRFYILNLIINNITMVYDLDQKAWYIWSDYQGNWWPVVGAAFIPPSAGNAGIHLAQHATNGNVYPLDGDYIFPTDAETVFPVDIYTPNYSGDTMRAKMLSMLYVSCDRFQGNKLQVRYSDDDYASWSNFRTIDISVAKPRAPDWGTFSHRRAFHFRHEQAAPLRIRAVELQEDIGTL